MLLDRTYVSLGSVGKKKGRLPHLIDFQSMSYSQSSLGISDAEYPNPVLCPPQPTRSKAQSGADRKAVDKPSAWLTSCSVTHPRSEAFRIHDAAEHSVPMQHSVPTGQDRPICSFPQWQVDLPHLQPFLPSQKHPELAGCN